MEKTLAELAQLIRRCPNCDLAQTRTQAVPGDGPDSARIMFIGEGPGYNEDRSGHPFVGPAGRFLDELLATAGLKRADVFVTNVVKCRPPQNRDPLKDEIDACDTWLQQQIAAIDPPVIVTLGRYSMAKFFAGESISRIHGQPRTVGKRTIVPMFHPAAALHQERFRSLIVDDFRRLPEILTQVERQRAAAPSEPAEPQRPPEQGRLF
ncbi:MAG TPA: uracil-DNA glycosylase [Dehalococcoidia bacterium]|nr:uracil-DNA glycosylase [Dehalococcoidia bacterium]